MMHRARWMNPSLKSASFLEQKVPCCSLFPGLLFSSFLPCSLLFCSPYSLSPFSRAPSRLTAHYAVITSEAPFSFSSCDGITPYVVHYSPIGPSIRSSLRWLRWIVDFFGPQMLVSQSDAHLLRVALVLPSLCCNSADFLPAQGGRLPLFRSLPSFRPSLFLLFPLPLAPAFAHLLTSHLPLLV